MIIDKFCYTFQILLNLLLFPFLLPLIKFSPGEKKELELEEEQRKKISNQVQILLVHLLLHPTSVTCRV